MSRMELNKGTLIPESISPKEIADTVVGEEWKKYWDNKLEYFLDNLDEYGFAMVRGQLYQVDWEVRSGDMEEGFAEVLVNKYGEINFHTYHYNGGGSWEEVVEEELK